MKSPIIYEGDMKYKIGVIVIALALCACVGDPKETSATDNPNFQIDKLFTKDGITVYRFYDSGRYIYFTKNETDWNEQVGKQTFHEHVPSL